MITGYIKRQAMDLYTPDIVAGTIDYLEAQFFFQTKDWDGLTVWAHFRHGDAVYDIPLTDGRIRKEDGLNLSAGTWAVYLHGAEYTDGALVERITTEAKQIEVKPCGTLDGEPFPDVPASAIERLEARVERIEESGGGGSGQDGITPHIGANGNWWIGDTDTGVKAQGPKGPKGNTGEPGYTPKKGVDYYTASDKTEMVSAVIAALPVYGGEVESV